MGGGGEERGIPVGCRLDIQIDHQSSYLGMIERGEGRGREGGEEGDEGRGGEESEGERESTCLILR